MGLGVRNLEPKLIQHELNFRGLMMYLIYVHQDLEFSSLKICAGILMVGVTGLRSMAELGTDSEEHAVKRLDFSPNHGYLA